MAHPDEAHPSPQQDSAKPATGQPEPSPSASASPSPAPATPETKPVVSEAKPAENSVVSAPAAAPASDIPPAADSPVLSSPPVSPAPAGTVAMDPSALAPAAPPEEPRSEYHSPEGYDHSHHHDTYHDHHHGPGEDPYHYQYDEHYHHGPGEGHSTDHYGVPATTSGAGGGEDTIDPLFDDKPGEGGPVKPFLEHLEDLRWVIIKVAVATLIGMTVCLFAADRIVAMFKWPLERSTQISPDPRQHISLMFGPKEVLNFKLATNNLTGWPITTNRYVELELAPVQIGTNQIMALQVRKISEEVPFEKAKPIIYKGIAAPFINSLHIAFFGGLLMAAPFVAFFIVQFILPALRERERKYFIKAMAPATMLFFAGVCLCYFLILPLALRAADQYAAWMGVDIPFLEAGEYFGFCIKFMLGMGAGFEMPVILLALVKIGLLDYAKLAGFRRYMILINLILGALLTTPEVLTQVAMFIPLQFLYELTIWIAWYWEQPDRALARRRLVMVIIGFILFGVLVYYAWRYGWPWLMAQWKPAQ